MLGETGVSMEIKIKFLNSGYSEMSMVILLHMCKRETSKMRFYLKITNKPITILLTELSSVLHPLGNDLDNV